MSGILVALGCWIGLTACENENTQPQQNESTPIVQDQRETRFLSAKENEVLDVTIADLKPTQGAIGYDQIYYKLALWQPDLKRTTWDHQSAAWLSYLNNTLAKKFSDYCELIGAHDMSKFASAEDALKANLADLSSFQCSEPIGSKKEELKTVVVGYDGRLYLTDGHHSVSQFKMLADGGDRLKLKVRVVANMSDIRTADEFWQKMTAQNYTWFRDGNNQPITYHQLPQSMGLKSETDPDGLTNDPYRSLVYFMRDIGFDKSRMQDGATDFAEFKWADWLRKQNDAGQLKALSSYKTVLDASSTQSERDAVLATTRLKFNNQTWNISGSESGYAAAIADYSFMLFNTPSSSLIYADSTAQSLGGMNAAVIGQYKTSDIQDDFEDLIKSDVKSDQISIRKGGKIWYAVNYAKCGKPQSGHCWG